MRARLFTVTAILTAALTVSANARQTPATQSVTLSRKLDIPGMVLKPGEYTFSVEDRLRDRAIVRITEADTDKHVLVLTVPNAQLQGPRGNGLVLFNSPNEKKQVLRAWMCPGCSAGLEFVYPKAQAAEITGKSTQPVLAVDPESDKLPANLSADDMKVVTLWLLSPKPLTATDRQKGVNAAKYVPAASTPATEASGARASASTEIASTSTPSSAEGNHRGRLPKTASNNFSLMFWGLVLLLLAAGLHVARRREVR